MALLDIRNLHLSINGTDILSSVSLEVSAGEVLGIAGESGSGKSMTALAVAGLLPLGARCSASISLDGEALTKLSEDEYCKLRGKDIGMVFQEPMTALNPVMPIGEQVAECVRIHRQVSRSEGRRLASEALDHVGLPADRFPRDRYPHDLSGGQRQRVAIAIATVLKPKLLIADEPTTALDVTTQAGILDLFRRLVDEDGIGLVFITHDLGVLAQIADRIAVMKSGQIVAQDDAPTILKTSNHEYVQRLLSDAAHIPDRESRTPGDESLIESNNIFREYPGPRRLFGRSETFRAVDDVSLALHPNENVGLVGESGCGKSTLLRTLLGLDAAQSGEIRVAGRHFPADDEASNRELRRRIQVVFQDPAGTFDPRWRVHQLIAENFHLYDTPPSSADARRKVDEMLEKVDLTAADGDRYPHEFSGGQRQRIAIARALITEPDVIALDEAVSALDVSIRARILDLLAELSDRLGMSYLFVTHDLSVVRAITDRVLVMQAGRIVESGPTAEVFANPTHPYTMELLAAVPNIDSGLARRANR